jgi:uncharacterized membrane protein YeaQ/YmgE (transglycosylase-associated protein family)
MGLVAGLLVTAVLIGLVLFVAGGVVYILGLVLGGLVVGALGRLAVPGPNPMGLGMTLVVGLAGSFLGGLVGWFLVGRWGGWILSVAGAAFIVWLLERQGRHQMR